MSSYSNHNENEERTSPKIRICDLKEKYPEMEMEVYYGASVDQLGNEDEQIYDYDEETEVKDFEVLSPDEWMEKFCGESTGDIDWSTLVIVISQKIDEERMYKKMIEVAKNYKLGPMQTKIYALREIGVTNVKIAEYLGKDERVTSDSYSNAKKNIARQDMLRKQAAQNEELRLMKPFVGKTVRELVQSDSWDVVSVFRGKNLYDANRHSCDVEKHMNDLVVDYDTDRDEDDEGFYVNILYIII